MKTLYEFNLELDSIAEEMYGDSELRNDAFDVQVRGDKYKWIHQTRWEGFPALQLPQDLFTIADIVHRTQPKTIIELGVAWGGTTLFLESLANHLVVGVDQYLPSHLIGAAKKRNIELIQGDTVASFDAVKKFAGNGNCLIILDSMHTEEHVLAELEAYALLTSIGSYCIVFDTVIEDMPIEMHKNRPWNPGNSPKTAVKEFIDKNSEFKIDDEIQDKLLITSAPDGFLKRIK